MFTPYMVSFYINTFSSHMKEVRYFYAPEAATTDQLPDEEARHALRVLRLQSGDEMYLMDGKGNFYHAEVTLTASKRCLYKITETLPQTKTWKGNIHLAVAPTKMMERVEWMSEKATEIGFDEITFLECRFSERKQMRIDRIEKIVISAVKQSRKAYMPAVNDLTSFSEFIKKPIKGRKYIAHCYDEIEKKDFYEEISAPCHSEDDENITIMIGPEGDFSIDEVRNAIDAGFIPVSLGESRLRTETAGLSAVMMSSLARRKK